MRTPRALVVGLSVTVLFFSAGCNDTGTQRVSFVAEGDRCRLGSVIYLDERSGEQLSCEDYDYSGPLEPQEVDRVVSLARDLADEDCDLSEDDMDRVRAYAEDPAEDPAESRSPQAIGVYGISAGEGAVWVAGWADGYHLIRVDPRTGESRTVALPEQSGILLQVEAAGGSVWVIFERDPSVLRIDPETMEVTTLQPLDGDDVAAMFVDGADVWIAGGHQVDLSGGGSTVIPRLVRIDPADPEGGEELELPDDFYSVVALGDGSLWGSGEAGGLARFDLATGRRVGTVELTYSGDGAQYDWGTGLNVYTAGHGALWGGYGSLVIRIDHRINEVSGIIELQGEELSVRAIEIVDDRLWAATGTHLFAIDPATSKVTSTTSLAEEAAPPSSPPPSCPWSSGGSDTSAGDAGEGDPGDIFRMDFGEGSLWLADYLNDRLLRVDTAAEELVEQVTLPKVAGDESEDHDTPTTLRDRD